MTIETIVKKTSRLLFALLFALSAGACSNDDDLKEIFIGHNWRLTFVQNGGERLPSDGKEYKILFSEGVFTFSTPTGATLSGNWQASSSGDKRTFGCRNIKVTGNIASDNIATAIKDILENATTYEGTSHYLKIIHTRNAFVQFYNR